MAVMKRPSDVPPVVESSGGLPVSASMAATRAALSVPRGVRKGEPPKAGGDGAGS